MELQSRLETLEGESLKTAAELALHGLARLRFNQWAFDVLRGGERIENAGLHTEVAGLAFENPLMVGAGWDKRGWAVDGLHALGFAGTEVGSVLAYPQAGNPRPRLWYREGAGLNTLGFNSKGMEAVADCLAGQKRLGVTGISLGKNKLISRECAPWAHAAVAEHLYDYADYFTVNVASPNTPGLRDLLDSGPLSDIVRAVKDVLAAKGDKPLFIKTTVDLALVDLDKVLQLCADEKLGIIDTNTTVDEEIKAHYGWQGRPGGVSGANGTYRYRATERMKYITRTTRGDNVPRIGVGAINDTDSALERVKAGAQVVQIVTGIRQRKGRIARDINAGLLKIMEKDGVRHIEEYVAADV